MYDRLVVENFPPELRRRFRAACVEADTTMSAVVPELVRGWLAAQAAAPVIGTHADGGDGRGRGAHSGTHPQEGM